MTHNPPTPGTTTAPPTSSISTAFCHWPPSMQAVMAALHVKTSARGPPPPPPPPLPPPLRPPAATAATDPGPLPPAATPPPPWRPAAAVEFVRVGLQVAAAAVEGVAPDATSCGRAGRIVLSNARAFSVSPDLQRGRGTGQRRGARRFRGGNDRGRMGRERKREIEAEERRFENDGGGIAPPVFYLRVKLVFGFKGGLRSKPA